MSVIWTKWDIYIVFNNKDSHTHTQTPFAIVKRICGLRTRRSFVQPQLTWPVLVRRYAAPVTCTLHG